MSSQPASPSVPAERLELLALGEVMLRLSPPGHGRLEFSRTLEVDVGGGEYNVAHALARLGHATGIATALPDNELTRVILQHARAAGMSTEFVRLNPFDGVGRTGRVGLYFAEIGMGPRGGLALFDRAGSDASRMQPADLDWDQFMRRTRRFHCSGIFPVLSESSRATLRAAVAAAVRHGVALSYDLNFRSKLCTPAAAAEINREIAASAQVLLGSPEGFAAMLELNPAAGESIPDATLIDGLRGRFPSIRHIAATRRVVRSGSRHELSGWLWTAGHLHPSRIWTDLEIEDRVGSGDAFAAGILHGLARRLEGAATIEFAVAYAALLHTTRGDTSQFTEAEVVAAMNDTSAAMKR